MSDNKYLGVTGLEELIILTKNDLAKKADTLQFDVMPDPNMYIGKLVQYVGVTDTKFTCGHSYYSNGTEWQDTIDTALSEKSTNAVQNKVIYAAIKDVREQVTNVYHYKGSCLTADLPMTNNKVGDTWSLEDSSSYGPTGTNVAWDGAKWNTINSAATPDEAPTDGSQHPVMSGGVYNALLTKEDKDNKVTAITASATDTQYPSAKAVYNALENLEPIPSGFVQNVDTEMQPVEDGKVMRISKTAFNAITQRDTHVMYYLDEEHDLIDAKPTCRDIDGNLVKDQKIVELSKAEYEGLEVKDPDTYYMVNDDNEARTWYPKPDWGNAIKITPTGSGYTAPTDGMFVGSISTSIDTNDTAGTAATLTINDTVISKSNSNKIKLVVSNVPVSKNDIIKFTHAGAWSNVPLDYNILFVPWKA